MTRRSTPRKKVDDWAFPIRVKVVVPELGFGQRIDLYLAWLRALERTEYAMHPEGHACAFYFRALETAERFLAAFPELELADAVEKRGY